LIAIAQQRLVQVVMMLIVLYLIVTVIVGVLALSFIPASSVLTSLASIIIPSYSIDGMGALMNPMANGMSGGAMGGAMMGLAVLLVGLSALLMQVWVLGLNVVYLQAADGVVCADVGTSEFCDG